MLCQPSCGPSVSHCPGPAMPHALPLSYGPELAAFPEDFGHDSSLAQLMSTYRATNSTAFNWTDSIVEREKFAELSRYEPESQNPVVKALLIVAYSVIIVTSLFGNMLVSHVVLQSRRMHLATSLFIANLALSDIMITLLNTPSTVVRFVNSTWIFRRAMCHISRFVQYCSLHVSTLTLTAIALDRHQAVLNPLQQQLWLARGALSLAAIWLLSACFSLPHSIYQRLLRYRLREGTVRSLCLPDFPKPTELVWKHLDLSTFLLLYLLPLLVNSAAYARLAKRLWLRNAIGDVTARQHAAHHRSKKKSVKMLVLVVFAVCWFPLNCYVVLISSLGIKARNSLYFALHWFAMSSTCYNPFIYCWLNNRFRAELCTWLCPCRQPPRPQPPPTSHCWAWGQRGGCRKGLPSHSVCSTTIALTANTKL